MSIDVDTGTRDESAKRGQIRGIHVLLGAVAFFGVIFLVNGIFLYSALSTYTGVVSKQPYRKGLAYNEMIAADEKQKQLGWQEAVTLDGAAGRLVVTFKDRDGAPVTGLAISGVVGRPSTDQLDADVTLKETQSGHYEALVGPHAEGVWLVQLKADLSRDGGRETVYRIRRRLWLKP
jgi:nitrogen fixation protein FixH